ncbi:MAG: FAD-dependent oxidoreductase [Bacteroidales bacterium]|nr:FAD-dependent oxidoreductase [Bacteroidales bacterium]
MLLLLNACDYTKDKVFIEAESFRNYGGWVNDAQFIDQMGSPYLMAHGLGVPVEDASTVFEIKEPGSYHLYVRTFNWVAPHGGEPAPGLFTISIDGMMVDKEFGKEPDHWGWVEGGSLQLENGKHTIRLHDRTGFNGRIDAVFLSKKEYEYLPESPYQLFRLRTRTGAIPKEISDEGNYDLVVVGGGIAGISAAVTAARLGLKTALIQNRPILGGNNSSEVRVHLVGSVDHNLYPALGNIVRALNDHHPPNAAEAEKYNDDLKLQLVKNQTNLDLFLNTHVNWLEIFESRIESVYAINTITGQQHVFHAKYFADCTGDGNVGALAGADYRYGRESRETTGEPSAPIEADSMTMGSSNLWRSTLKDTASGFPEVPWALHFTDKYFIDATSGTWRWESGFDRDIIEEAEYIRDHNLRAVFGNWSYLKNNLRGKYDRYSLDWVAHVSGKRESRRLLGDVILSELDIINDVQYEDAAVTLTWGIDVHFADTLNSRYFPGKEFISWYTHPKHDPYHMPYRCLYSRNIENLFMAGRNISVTHIGLGSPRVMRTGGVMGEVVGMAASICTENKCIPRDVYEDYLDELKRLMQDGV